MRSLTDELRAALERVQISLDAEARSRSPQVKQSTLKYGDGGTYTGEVLDGRLRHGHGTMGCPNGDSYEGGWRLDVRHGQGTFTAGSSGLKYQGQWLEDKAHGQGTSWAVDGTRYEGGWQQDQRSGWGTLRLPNGDCYEGEWSNNHMHGGGRYSYKDGGYFEGEFERGARVHGREVAPEEEWEYVGGFKGDLRHDDEGVLIVQGLFLYRGSFRKGLRHGSGRCEFAGGGVHVGQYREDARWGWGRTDLPSGWRYEGDWEEDRPHGKGTCQLESGDRYVGQFQKGLQHGHGRCKFAAGGWYEGEWVHGKAQGTGQRLYGNGDVYVGQWEEGRRQGQGGCRFAGGGSFQGVWKDDKPLQLGADPRRCRAAGKGLSRAVAGEEAEFRIQARDSLGNSLLDPSQEHFTLRLELKQPAEPLSSAAGYSQPGHPTLDAPKAKSANPVAGSNQLLLLLPPSAVACGTVVAVAKGETAMYQATFRAPTCAGSYSLHILNAGGQAVADSPFALQVAAGQACPRRCTVMGPGRSAAVVGQPAEVCVELRDEYGNLCRAVGRRQQQLQAVESEQPQVGVKQQEQQQQQLQEVQQAQQLQPQEPSTQPKENQRQGWREEEEEEEEEDIGMTQQQLLHRGQQEQRLERRGQQDHLEQPRHARPCVQLTVKDGVQDVLLQPVRTALGGSCFYFCYSPARAGHLRLEVTLDGSHVRGSPFPVEVAAVGAPPSNEGEEQEGAVVDQLKLWGEVARQQYGTDGSWEGWDSSDEDSQGSATEGRQSTEKQFIQAHPGVPVVERLEDLWVLSKLLKERKGRGEGDTPGRDATA